MSPFPIPDEQAQLEREKFVVIRLSRGMNDDAIVGPLRFRREVAQAEALVLEADSISNTYAVATVTWTQSEKETKR